MKILVVRAVEDARRTAAKLKALGHAPIISPALRIRTIPIAMPAGAFDATIATSAHAFDAPIPAPLKDIPLYVVGARTAELARKPGWAAPVTSAPDAATLAADLARALPHGARALYLAGRDRKDVLERALADAIELTVVECYAAEPAIALSDEARAGLAADEIDSVLHYSRRSASIFLALATQAGLDLRALTTRHIAISADVAAPLHDLALPVIVAATPDEDAMLACI